MTKISPLKLALATIGVAIGIVAAFALRSATLSTHEQVDARQTVLVVSARTHGGEPGQELAEMVEDAWLARASRRRGTEWLRQQGAGD